MVPDVAGDADPNTGYDVYVHGAGTVVGGTSAVAPLYAGLIAVINANIGQSLGFINPTLYSAQAQSGKVFRDTLGAPGPANNSLNGVTGYPAGPGWDACTGFGSVDGTALQTVLSAGATTSTAKTSAAGASTKNSSSTHAHAPAGVSASSHEKHK